MKIVEITVRSINNTISPEKKEIARKERENAIRAFNQAIKPIKSLKRSNQRRK